MIRALLVDDERLARHELRSLLANESDVEVAGEAGTLEEARRLLDTLVPDVVFLDIELGARSGFDLLESLREGTRVIFVTAHEEYAVRAFEVSAVDYLMKPVHPERLHQSLLRIAPQPERRLALDDRLLLPANGHHKLVKVRSIESIFAAGDYSEVHLAGGTKLLVLRSLREWEERLPEKHFVRVHRSAIVNVDAVERVEEWFRSSLRIHLKGRGEPVIGSRRFAARLRARFR